MSIAISTRNNSFLGAHIVGSEIDKKNQIFRAPPGTSGSPGSVGRAVGKAAGKTVGRTLSRPVEITISAGRDEGQKMKTGWVLLQSWDPYVM